MGTPATGPRGPRRILAEPTRSPLGRAPVKLNRPTSWFLFAFGAWSWVIWITFARNLVKDASGLAFDDAGAPSAYFWVHLALAVTSFILGTAVGVIGLKGVRANSGK